MGLRSEHAALVDRYLRALAAGDRSAAGALFDDDYVEIYPQSGERLVGRDRAVEAMARQPTGPLVIGSPHVASCGEDRILIEGLLDYAGSPHWLVALLEVHGSRIHRATAYFGAPFEAPAWRAQWAARYDPLDPAEWAGEGDGRATDPAAIERSARDSTSIGSRAIAADVHPDYQASFPQSGERFDQPGLQATDDHYPGGLPAMRVNWVAGQSERWVVNPANVPVRVSGGGDTWASEILLHYPSGDRYHGLSVLIFRDGRLWRQRFYYVAPFEPAPFRADLIERFDPEVALG